MPLQDDSFAGLGCCRHGGSLSDEKAKCLSMEQALTDQIVNSLRDAAQHFLLEVSEQPLLTRPLE